MGAVCKAIPFSWLLFLIILCHSGFSYRLRESSSLFSILKKNHSPLSTNRLHAFLDHSHQKPSLSTKEALLQYFNTTASSGNIYVCPESLEPLAFIQRRYGFFNEKYFLDQKYGAKYPITPCYIDFISNEDKGLLSKENNRWGQLFFQIPLVSYFYERGYRQNFQLYGFPGIEKEFKEAKEYFVNASATAILVDLSCGSGFMTRRFIKSGRFDRVIAADLSPTMLLETRQNCKSENIEIPELVRCDSAKLPFQSNSIDAIHAGAAMHCWPRISKSLSEIYRALKPGGVYFATTIKQPGNTLKRAANSQGFTLFESKEELEKLLRDAGFDSEGGSHEVRLEGERCFVIKAKKTKVSEILTIPVN